MSSNLTPIRNQQSHQQPLIESNNSLLDDIKIDRRPIPPPSIKTGENLQHSIEMSATPSNHTENNQYLSIDSTTSINSGLTIVGDNNHIVIHQNHNTVCCSQQTLARLRKMFEIGLIAAPPMGEAILAEKVFFPTDNNSHSWEHEMKVIGTVVAASLIGMVLLYGFQRLMNYASDNVTTSKPITCCTLIKKVLVILGPALTTYVVDYTDKPSVVYVAVLLCALLTGWFDQSDTAERSGSCHRRPNQVEEDVRQIKSTHTLLTPHSPLLESNRNQSRNLSQNLILDPMRARIMVRW